MLAAADARIAWVLAHPHMSDWLKQALRSADARDPTGLQNDVEMLRHLLVPRARARIAMTESAAPDLPPIAFSSPGSGNGLRKWLKT